MSIRRQTFTPGPPERTAPILPTRAEGRLFGYTLATLLGWPAMKGMTITWHEGPFTCEFSREPTGKWLSVLNGDQLVAREALPTVSAAYQRAREIVDALPVAGVRPA